MHRKQLQQMVRDALKDCRGVTPTFNKNEFTISVSNADTSTDLRHKVRDALKAIDCGKIASNETAHNVIVTYSYPAIAKAA